MTFGFDVRGKLKGALAFVQHEAAGGLVLMVAALAALLSMAGLAGCNDDSSPQPATTTQGASPG
jgi:hypothetical protein